MRALLFCSLFSLSSLLPSLEAKLVFETQKKELTSQLNEMKLTLEYPFINTSDKDVTIQQVKTSCSCLTAEIPENKFTISPGQKSKVLLHIDLGVLGGKIEKNALVVTSEGEQIPLDLKITIPDFVKMEPRTLRWVQGEAPKPKTMKFLIDPALSLKLKDVSVSSPNFEFEPKTVIPGREYALIVTPKSTASPDYSMLRVETDSDIPRYKKSMGFLTIDPPKNKKK